MESLLAHVIQILANAICVKVTFSPCALTQYHYNIIGFSMYIHSTEVLTHDGKLIIFKMTFWFAQPLQRDERIGFFIQQLTTPFFCN